MAVVSEVAVRIVIKPRGYGWRLRVLAVVVWLLGLKAKDVEGGVEAPD